MAYERNKRGANLHSGDNLLPGAKLHPGANCAHEHGLSEPRYEKTGFLHMRKQRRRSASR